MKKYFTFFVFAIIMIAISCKEDEVTMIDEMIDVTGNDTLAFGEFISAAHTTSGHVTILKDSSKLRLVFENFKVDPGPSVWVYLSSNIHADDNFINLGKLKATSGNFSYEIPMNADLIKQNHVLIWCLDFRVLMGYSKLAN